MEACGIGLMGKRRAAVTLHAAGAIDRNHYYDWLTEVIMAKCIKRDSVCVDVGCHAGSMLRQMLGHAPQGRHLAFEPLPDFFAKLQRDFNDSRIRLFQLALSNEEGSVSFQHAVENPAYSGLRRRQYKRENEVVREITVKTRKLDNVLADEGVDALDFVKIDVEGAERLVLEGARESIARFKPVIVFECGLGGADFYQTTPEAIYKLLAGCGLKLSCLSDFLAKRPSLTSEQFARRFTEGMDYFWVAHP